MPLRTRLLAAPTLVGLVAVAAATGRSTAAPASSLWTSAQTSTQASSDSSLVTPVKPLKGDNAYFFVGDDGALYVREANASPRRLIDAGAFSAYAPSPDGKFVAYAGPTTQSWAAIRIRDVKSARDVNAIIPAGRLSNAPWTRNSKGFVYARIDTTEKRERVYYHRVAEGSDEIVYSRQDEPSWSYDVRVSDDGQYLVFTISHPGDKNNRMYFIDVDNPDKPNINAPVVKLIDQFDAPYQFIDNADRWFILYTTNDAPNGKVILANTNQIRESRWPTMVPESAESLLVVRTAGKRYLIAVSRTTAAPSKYIARVYAAPTEKERRDEIRRRMDSVRKAPRPPRDGSGGPPGGGPGGPMGPRMDIPTIRLNLKTEIPLPEGSTLIAMTSNAEDKELFYTVRLANGALQSFMYTVDLFKNQPFDTRPPSVASKSTQ